MITLDNLEVNQVLIIDGKERAIKFSATLHSLVQFDGSKEWVKSGKSYKAVFAGDWFMNLPLKEGGKSKWFKLEVKEEGSTLNGFFLGSKEEPGPARRFAKSGEREKVSFNLFDESWTMTDIGAFDIQSSGKSEIVKDGDRLYYIIGIQGEEKIFLYLDSRPKEANGIGASLVGTVFNPETEIESIL